MLKISSFICIILHALKFYSATSHKTNIKISLLVKTSKIYQHFYQFGPIPNENSQKALGRGGRFCTTPSQIWQGVHLKKEISSPHKSYSFCEL